MRSTLVSFAVLLVLVVGSRPASANARHDLIGATRAGNGANLRVQFTPSQGYNRVTFGVYAGAGNRYSSMTLNLGSFHVGQVTERHFHLPYDGQRFRPGATVTLISIWPRPTSGNHNWGNQTLQLP